MAFVIEPIPRAKRCPRWPNFGRFRPSHGPRWSCLGPNYLFFIRNQLLFDTFGTRNNPRARGCPRFCHCRPSCGPRWSWLGPNYLFFIWNQLLFATFGFGINPRARGCPGWPSFSHYRPWCGPRWSWLGLNYPYFIGNQNLFYTFGPRMIPRAKGCPRWQLLAISGPPVVLGGHGLVPIIHLSLGIYSYSTLFDLESTWGPEGAPDGQVLGRFRPPWGPWGLRLGSNYPFFTCDRLLIHTFGSRIDPRAKRWPWWPSFGRFRLPRRPRGSKRGAKWSLQLFITTWFYKNLL